MTPDEQLLSCLRNDPPYGPTAAEVIVKQRDHIRRVEAERDYLNTQIHTCGPECPRLHCVQRREIDSLRQRLAEQQAVIDKQNDAIGTAMSYLQTGNTLDDGGYACEFQQQMEDVLSDAINAAQAREAQR